MTTLGYLRSVREWAYPTRTSSAFLEKGVLTPEEFVRAGDELCFRCPTWSWESGDASKQKSYLPPDKQYLVTRNVPCQSRVDDMEEDLAKALNQQGGGVDDEDAEWLVSTIGGSTSNSNAIEDDFDILDEDGEVVKPPPAIEEEEATPTETTNPPTDTTTTTNTPAASNDDDDGYADMADFEDDNVLMDDDNVVAATTTSDQQDNTTNSNTLQVRTYDLSITYDKYYQTPRVWMVGTSAQGQPLTAEEMMQDVMADYAHKTVTIENHPHVAGPHASIHPCQHGKVMKRIVQNLIKNSSNSGQAEQDDPPTVELYLFIFLKFVNSIIPTINYDFTMDVTASTQT